jgi:hypothetical protein
MTFNIAASFGVVGLFTRDLQAFRDFDSRFGYLPAYQEWFRNARTAFDNRILDGWFYPTLIDDIQSFAIHEVSSHSYSHLPFHNDCVTAEIVGFELQTMRDYLNEKGLNLETLIFPRNQVAFLDVLASLGIRGYRNGVQKGEKSESKVHSLLNELNIFLKSDLPTQPTVPSRVPSGHFLNWRSGPRLVVPPMVTVARFEHLLDHAEASGGVAHMWLHPHNLITGKQQLELLNRVLKSVSIRQKRGSLSVLTMGEYCRQQEEEMKSSQAS